MWKFGLRPCNSQKKNTQMGFSLQCYIKNFKKRVKALGLPMEVVDYKYCEHPTANEKKLGLMVTKRHEKVVLHADSKSLGCNFVC
jgi:hypothetical protein